jgi:hypothetical protein
MYEMSSPARCLVTILTKLPGLPYVELTCNKVVPVLNYAPRHEGVLREWRYNSTHSLTSVLDGGEWAASLPSRSTPREGAPGIHRIGGWVDARTVMDAVVKRKIPRPRRESNRRTPIVQPVVQRLTCNISAFSISRKGIYV